MTTKKRPRYYHWIQSERGRGDTGWLLRAFPHANQLDIILRAVCGTGVILGVEYVVEVELLQLEYWDRTGSFFTSPDIILSAFGLGFALFLLGQWGGRYVRLWEEVRPAFDVSKERYDREVLVNLENFYGKDHVIFLLFLGAQIGIYTVFGSDLPAGFLHVGFLHFFGVTALYVFYWHTVTIVRITNLPLVDLAKARPILSEVADFSVVVCLNWFAALAALVFYIGFFMGLEREIGIFYSVTVVIFVLVGLLVFLIPVMLLHEALAEAKRDRLNRIYRDYDSLFEAWRSGELEGDPSVAIDILEQRRKNTEALSTWPYRLVSVGKLILGSTIPAAISIIQSL